MEVDAGEVWESPTPGLRRTGRLFPNPQEALLARLAGASSLSRAVARSLEERHPVGAELTLDEAYRFLTEEAPLLSEAGVRVLLPGEGKLTRVGLRLRVGGRGSALTRFGLETVVDFDWQVAVGDALLSPAEFEELAARKIPLVSIRGEWVLLDRRRPRADAPGSSTGAPRAGRLSGTSFASRAGWTARRARTRSRR